MKSDPKSPLCYSCKFRNTASGSCHSSCINPAQFDDLSITANHHGIKKGWFTWPFNFDPVWLNNCDGYEEKEK